MKGITPEDAGLSSSRLSRIGTLMQGYVDENKLPGVVAVVARHGEVVYRECTGMMEVETEKPMQFDTIFRIYSMTKAITSVALMMLFEEGEFQLTDPVAKFIPEFADVKVFTGDGKTGVTTTALDRPITIKDLLTHTAGLTYDCFLRLASG